MSSNLKIDEDNYTVLITDEGGVIYNTDDKSTANTFKIESLRTLIYDNPIGALNSGLLYPVTRYMNSSFNQFIIERQPIEFTCYLDSGSLKYKMPWQVFVFELDNNLKFKSIKLYFRPMLAVTEHDYLYTFPNPFTDKNGLFHKDLIDSINNSIDVTESTIDLKIYNLFDSFFKKCIFSFIISSAKFDEDFVPSDLQNDISDFKNFAKLLKEIPLEKLLLLDFVPLKLNKKMEYDASVETTQIKDLISFLKEETKDKPKTFIDLIKRVL